MGRMYTGSFDNIDISNMQDVFELTAPLSAIVYIHSFWVGQSSDYGDAAAEGAICYLSKATTFGSGGTTVTPIKHEDGDAAFGGILKRNSSTRATGLTAGPVCPFNIQAGCLWQPTPKEIIVLAPSGIAVVTISGVMADALRCHGHIVFEAIG